MSLETARSLALQRITRESVRIGALAAASIAVATLIVLAIERGTEIRDASAVYLVAVVIVGSVGGASAAVGTALAAFIIYDLLFTEPRFSLAVADTTELLNLVRVLIVALAIGRLAGLSRERAAEADRRAAEATGLFAISRLLATAEDTETVASAIAERLARDTGLERVWIGLEGGPKERILADTGLGPQPNPTTILTLVRMPNDEPARWIRAHDAVPRRGQASRAGSGGTVIRTKIETEGTAFGWMWAVQSAGTGPPDRQATRLLSLAADQIALSLRRDRLRQDATGAEVARRSDALKSALLDSVSHDLRTPLASIRATAGNLADPALAWSPDDVRKAADSIDDEALRLDRFVRSVLDLSRIESGALRPDLEVFDIRELVEPAVVRFGPVLGERPVRLEFAPDLPLVRVDAVLFDAILANVLDNIADHTPSDAPVSIRAARGDPGRVRVTIEDGGPGVAAPDLPFIFEKFHRVRGHGEGARRGMGVGLSIVRGLAEALGGSVAARQGDLGGLAIELGLEAAPDPQRRTVHMAVAGAHILLVEDDDATRASVAANLAAHGYRVAEAADVRSALDSWELRRPDVTLLDLGLPDADGLVLIRRVRREATTPFVVLSARDAEPDKVVALENGADDYVTKPFGLPELRARIGALLRRSGGPAADAVGRVMLGHVVLDVSRRTVTVAGSPVDLTPREYELLKTMISQPGRLVTRGRLLRAVWGAAYGDEAHYLHVYVSRLRRKLDAADPTGAASALIVAEPGVGYRIAEVADVPDEPT